MKSQDVIIQYEAPVRRFSWYGPPMDYWTCASTNAEEIYGFLRRQPGLKPKDLPPLKLLQELVKGKVQLLRYDAQRATWSAEEEG